MFVFLVGGATIGVMVDLESYAQAWRERWAQETADDARAAHAARAVANRLAQVLKSEFEATHVWLIGSLARGSFHRGSDIDLVVEGLLPERYFQACARLAALAGDLEVDLAPRRDLRPRAVVALKSEGISL